MRINTFPVLPHADSIHFELYEISGDANCFQIHVVKVLLDKFQPTYRLLATDSIVELVHLLAHSGPSGFFLRGCGEVCVSANNTKAFVTVVLQLLPSNAMHFNNVTVINERCMNMCRIQK